MRFFFKNSFILIILRTNNTEKRTTKINNKRSHVKLKIKSLPVLTNASLCILTKFPGASTNKVVPIHNGIINNDIFFENCL